MKQAITTIVIWCCLSNVLAQTITINGQVIDNETKEGIPFCNVYFEGSTVGTTTDLDGFYTMTLVPPKDTITVSAIGYRLSKHPVLSTDTQTVDFKLVSADLTFKEVVVIAGENPANEIVRNIAKHKRHNRLSRLKAYQVEGYEKIEIDLYNMNEKIINSKLMRPFDFIFEGVDSAGGEKPHLPTFLIESLYNQYVVRPSKNKKQVFARKELGINNASVLGMMDKFHEDFDIYDNWVTILEKNFLSPFANSGLGTYEYYIQDSAFIEGYWSYQLRFKPKRKRENTFRGTFWVIDSTFAIQAVDMVVSEDANINFVDQIKINEVFAWQAPYWLPRKKSLIIDVLPVKKLPGVIGRKTTSFRHYQFDKARIINALDSTKKIRQMDYLRNDAFWAMARHDTLSRKEKAIYGMIDSLKKTTAFRRYRDVSYVLLGGRVKVHRGNKKIGPVEVGPYYQMYSRNIAEGHRFQLGLRSDFFNRTVRLNFAGAYGTKDKKFKYDARLRWKARPDLMIGASYTDNVSSNIDDNWSVFVDNSLTRAFRRDVPRRLVSLRSTKFFVERTWEGGWSNYLSLENRYLDPIGKVYRDGSGFNFAYLPDQNDITQFDTTLTTTEAVFKTRLAKGEKKITGQFTNYLIGYSSLPIVELTYKVGQKNVLKSQFNYHKLQLTVQQRMHISPLGRLFYNFEVGKIFGTLPSLLLHVHPGHEAYSHHAMRFGTMNLYEFVSDEYANLMVEFHFDGFFFNKIPLIRRLNWRSIGIFRSAYGILSSENQAINQLNSSDVGGTIPVRSPIDPYLEAGFGVENIFKFLRIDALWRLNYLDNQEALPFMLQIGLNLAF